MSILVDGESRLLVQGITGRDGAFHTAQMLEYGTRVVAGVTPGKGGQKVHEIPVFNAVLEAKMETDANASVIYVPAKFAPDAIRESIEAEIPLIVCITEGVPVLDMIQLYHAAKKKNVRLIGPNCPGIISPGKSKIGIMPGEICTPGSIGVISRSGTLTYEIIHELTRKDMGQSTCIGIGGDPIVGMNFRDLLALFAKDEETEGVVLVGEIGGDEEEKTAEWITSHFKKPVFTYIVGQTAPEGKRMGHAGAIVSGNRGTAQSKIDAFNNAGIKVAKTIDEVAEMARKTFA